MPSTEPTASGRSRDELLAQVVHRGRQLRRRRRAVQGVSGAALVLVAGLVIGQVAGAGGDEEHLVADGPTTMAPTTTAPATTVPSTTAVTTTTTTAPPPPETSTTAAPPDTTSEHPGPGQVDELASLVDLTFSGWNVTEAGQPRQPAPGTQWITVAFERNSSTGDDVVRWEAGCNTFGGSVESIDGRLRITDVGSTAIGCDDAHHGEDEWLTAFMLSGPAWTQESFDEREELTLRADDTVIVVNHDHVEEGSDTE